MSSMLSLFDAPAAEQPFIAPTPDPEVPSTYEPGPCIGCNRSTRLAVLVCTQTKDVRVRSCLAPGCYDAAVEYAREQ